ncbi:phage tail tube protein [Nitrososphaera viennensis]|uniref:Phage tail tube protein n=2 Tax=Nitrososphaera viennensis TaxID=1034015 RepID=A0A977NLJ3_9ARCH|nr:phage tail tube protein [Nitrososphaera viennensis]AIC16951.1 putative major tail protein [Nitrososphaera viennensis EN76]UVS68854.1 phage tail tube protein [Nitrososphaera viennensis]CBX88961.1 putative major tail protein [Nitrososphaera phage Pro-Nvie1]
MSYTPTGSFNILKRLQFVEESTFGQAPASPSFVLAGHNVSLRETTEVSAQKYRDLGSRDLYKMLKTGEMYSFELRYQPINTALLRYGTELPNGAGTIEKSLAFVYTQLVNGTETWHRFLGARTDQVEIEVTEASVQVSHRFLCKDIPATVTADPFTTPTYAGADTSAPYTGVSSGSNPLTINSETYDTPRFKVSVNWNLDVVKPNGEVQAKFILPTNRDITVEFDTWVKDDVLRADTKSLAARSASYTIAPGKSLTFTDLYLAKQSKNNDANDAKVLIETLTGTARSMSVSP